MKNKSLSNLKTVIDITSMVRRITIEEVWDKLVDWDAQSDWMMATKVWSNKSSSSNGVGVRISAFSGMFPDKYSPGNIWSKLGILDTMEVTKWESPTYCEVLHDGAVIKGIGGFRLETIDNGVRFYWQEEIDAPWPVLLFVRPFILIAVKLSLRRFHQTIINS